MTLNTIAEKVKEVTIVVLRKGKEGFAKAVNELSALAGEALSACEAKKAAADIQAQGALYNLQRQAIREMPVLTLNQEQSQWLMQQAFNNFPDGVGKVYLDSNQAYGITLHMIKQHSLDSKSRKELSETVANIIGLSAAISPVNNAHQFVAEKMILPVINKGEGETLDYEDIIPETFYEGTVQGIKLIYNLHSVERGKKIYFKYYNSRKNSPKTRQELLGKGIKIKKIVFKGIYLNVYLT